MALSESEKKELAEVVRSAVADGCLCGHKEHVVRLFQRVEAIGEGNIEKGIESTGKSIEFINKVRHWGEDAGGKIALAILQWAIFVIIAMAGVGIWIKYGGK